MPSGMSTSSASTAPPLDQSSHGLAALRRPANNRGAVRAGGNKTNTGVNDTLVTDVCFGGKQEISHELTD
eukprot:534597-Prorocentrum_minimum.AAC.2